MRLIMLLAALLLLGGTAGAQPPKQAPKKMEELLGEARGRMSGVFHTNVFQEKMPFSKFLQLLEKEIAKEKPFSIHFDREAFGNDADKMLNAEVNLPPVPARMVFNTALRLALAQAHIKGQEIEFTARPDTLVITTRDRSLFTVTYEIGDLLKHTRHLHQMFLEQAKKPRLIERFGPGPQDFDSKADPAKPDEWIVRQLIALSPADRAGWHGRTPASTIRLANGSKLIVHTTPSVHDHVYLNLAAWRQLLDVAVVMDAKLYAIDRADYDEHFAPAFGGPKDKSVRKLVVKVNDALSKKLRARKPFMESDAVKLRPNERAEFLAVKNAYQYQSRPGDAKPTTAFEGFSFSVRPKVSPDRRCLRLEFFHDVEQLIKLTKGTMIDPKTGKELPIELPNLRVSASSGTIEIHDMQAIILAVDYRPKDKVWLMLAEPMIYLEEEQENIRKGAIKPIPPADVEKEPAAKPLVELPGNDDVKQILKGIVENVLTDPEHKKMHAPYGTPGDAKFTLLTGYTLNWPKGFRPNVAGFTYQELDPDECRGFKKRLLGIRVDTFEWTPSEKNPKGAKVVVVLDDAIHGRLGALRIVYHVKRDGKRWKVE
jgi:hypothetical protein